MAQSTRSLKVAASTNLDNVSQAVDWKLCCLCQSKDTKTLICPAKNPNVAIRNAGYISLTSALGELKHFAHILPSNLRLESLDEGNGIEQTLITRRAQWHKACHSKYSGQKLQRLKQNLMDNERRTDDQTSSSRVTRAKVPLVPLQEYVCFLCTEPERWNLPLHNAATDGIFEHVKACATSLQDSKLLATLSAGDLVAQEAKYYRRCLTRLYNRCRVSDSRESDTGKTMCEGLAFSDLLNYIQSKMESETVEYIFKMPDLVHMYHARVVQLLGVAAEDVPFPQTSRFRSKILAYVPGLKEVKSGRGYVLMKKSANIHRDIPIEDFDDDAIAFQRLVKNLRVQLSKITVSFSGQFSENCEEQCIPPALLAIVNSILYGRPVHPEGRTCKPALTICQLFISNHQQTMPQGKITRNKRTHEPPLPLYIALSIYGRHRNKKMIDELHEYGLSVSSSRVMEVTADLCYLVVERANEQNVLCPANLRNGLFTVAAFDNVDHTPSSTTSEGSFNGTSMSIFQLPTQDNPGEKRTFSTSYRDVQKNGRRSIPHLPPSYASVPDHVQKNKQPPVPSCSQETGLHMCSMGNISMEWKKEDAWLAHIRDQMLPEQNVGQMLNQSWAAFHVTKVREDVRTACINSLLPLFYEHSATVSMVRHGMDITRQITSHVNNVQTPVMFVDQPLFALGKIVQWNWPELFGEDKFVLLFAPFHIEQTFLRVIGQFMQESGWIGIAVNSGIITKGSAEAIMKVTHVTKARAMHRVTAAVLYDLMHGAFEIDNPGGEKTLETWISESCASSPTIMFWLSVLNLEILLLTFVRAIRLGNYHLFKESLKRMMPWFFAFNHVNYSRWVAVHLKDLEELEKKAPDVHHEFCSGNFVIRKTSRPFSALAVDQAHEQNNAKVKGSGGAIGLTQDAGSLRRWMIAGPEVTRLLTEFQGPELDMEFDTHHEQYPAYQNKFLERCIALKESFLQLGNPFGERGTDLISLDSRVIAAPEGVQALYNAEKLGTVMYQTFVQERLVTNSKSLYDPIHKLSTKIFAPKSKSSQKLAMKSLTTDICLFSRLFIVSRERDLDLDLFFRHENQKCPPSLTRNGQIRSGKKADLAEKLENLISSSPAPIHYDGLIYDGAALVHAVRLATARTFGEYFSLDLQPYILKQINSTNVNRVDVVWDLYLPDSLKNTERDSRGTGTRRQVLPDAKLPSDWSEFLQNASNKMELFQYFGRCLLDGLATVNVVTNTGNQIASSVNGPSSLSGTNFRGMEEAAGRIMMHAHDMVKHGAKRLLIKCSDTDVLVLCISFFSTLRAAGLQELWLLSGTGNKSRYIAVHDITSALGEEKAEALRGFHAFTGCESVSYFASKSKKTSWKTWISYPAATTAFKSISTPQSCLTVDVFRILEKFTALLYDPKTESSSVNQTRKDLFATKNKLLPFLPPTSAALHQHTLRAAYQAGHVWGNSLCPDITLPSPSLWGWKQSNGVWIPVWSCLPEIWEELSFLEKCGCKKGCDSQRCSCRRVGLPCTLQCTFCRGECTNRSCTNTCGSDEEL